LGRHVANNCIRDTGIALRDERHQAHAWAAANPPPKDDLSALDERETRFDKAVHRIALQLHPIHWMIRENESLRGTEAGTELQQRGHGKAKKH
jgi:hypothetical protein